LIRSHEEETDAIPHSFSRFGRGDVGPVGRDPERGPSPTLALVDRPLLLLLLPRPCLLSPPELLLHAGVRKLLRSGVPILLLRRLPRLLLYAALLDLLLWRVPPVLLRTDRHLLCVALRRKDSPKPHGRNMGLGSSIRAATVSERSSLRS